VHAAGSISRESLFNLALRLNESISEMIFLSSLRKFGSLRMMVNKSTKPTYVSAPQFLARHFYGKQILRHVPFVPFSGRGF
jgi:hypothetical protein